ncbi:hypothetical protein AGMMS49941_04580 [Deferribacterales bacterium]|nr:hypothetical protein AGMMS49941_04580 [Deferribacterales bacterium]
MPTRAEAVVFVYQVYTRLYTYIVVSKLRPDAYWAYNGGFDVIYDLKILRQYPDEQYDKAIKDYRIDRGGYRRLKPKDPDDKPHPRHVPDHWWR